MLNVGRIGFTVVLLLIVNAVSFCQEADTARVFTTLEEALINPDQVIKLSLKRKRLKEIPQAVYQFPNLTWLDISKNQLKVLPSEIAKLQKLEYLNVSNNNLDQLPDDIVNLVNLKRLIANQNNLTGLPAQLGNCEKLQFLDLWSNNIEDLPESLSKCQDLKVIDMRVIMTSDSRQREMQQKIPQARILFSPGCNCGH